MITNRPNVYLAGPLFSSAEKQWNTLVSGSLSSVADIYVPQEDGALLVDLMKSGISHKAAKEIIFDGDLSAIERSDILLLIMDGRVIDEGACFELGYAFARGKTCIGLKTDVRSLLQVGDNPMIECALRMVFDRVEAISDWIERGLYKAQ